MNFSIDHLEVTAVAIDAGDNLGSMGLEQRWVSEEIIGRWLKATGKRDRVLVATKVRGAMGQNFSEGDDHPLQ